MATHTASGAYSTAPLRRVEKGNFTIDSGNHAFGATTFSVSDTLLACRIPQGVTVWNWNVKFFCKEASGEILLRVGTTDLTLSLTASASVTLFIGSGFQATNAGARAALLPFKISLSDDAANLWDYLKVVRLAGTITTSDLVRVWLTCSMDETHAVEQAT